MATKNEIINLLKGKIGEESQEIYNHKREMKADKDIYKPYWQRKIKKRVSAVNNYKKAIQIISNHWKTPTK